MTVHSLRRTIAKWAGEQMNIRAEAIEALLNHSPRDVTRRHYNQNCFSVSKNFLRFGENGALVTTDERERNEVEKSKTAIKTGM